MTDNKNMKEKISALADGELSEFEVRRILDEISANPDYREFWRNIHITKNGLLDEVNSFHESDISKKLKKALLQEPTDEVPVNRNWLSDWPLYASASLAGFCAVVLFANFNTFSTEDSFAVLASQKIDVAINSPQALEVLSQSVSGMNVELQDFKTNTDGVLANYKLPSSGETFKVSLYPIKEINKIMTNEATKITYVRVKDGVYVFSISGNLSADKKNQILQKVNLFAD